MEKQTLRVHIRNLEKKLAVLEAKREMMTGPEYSPPNACCPSCCWGGKLDDLLDDITRRRKMLNVFRCRKEGLRPAKTRRVYRRAPCGICRATGRTTIWSVGRCDCQEKDCPGRGICHACKGTKKLRMEDYTVTRQWPPSKGSFTSPPPE